MPFFDPFISINTALTAISTERSRRLNKQQLQVAREQAVREVQQFEREQERQDMELRYRLDTDAQFRHWYEHDQQVKRERLAMEAAQRAYQAQVDAEATARDRKESADRFILFLFVLFVPWLVLALPVTRRMLARDRLWLVAAWAVALPLISIYNHYNP